MGDFQYYHIMTSLQEHAFGEVLNLTYLLIKIVLEINNTYNKCQWDAKVCNNLIFSVKDQSQIEILKNLVKKIQRPIKELK